MDRSTLHARLGRVAALARGSRWQRLAARPLAYLAATGFQRFLYPRTRRPWRRTAHTFYGAELQIDLPAGTDLFLTGGKTHDSEVRLARYLLNTLRAGDTFVDIGAHYGYFSLLAATLVGENGRVLAAEAAPTTFRRLAANVEPYPRVMTFAGALAETAGEMTFYEFPVQFSEYNALDVAQYQGERWFRDFPPVAHRIPTQTLDALLARHQLQPSLIKIDVEGAEPRVIRGGANYLQAHHPVIVMEYLPGSLPHQEAAGQLLAWGYAAYTLTPEGMTVVIGDPEAYLKDQGLDSDNIVFQ
jgi:FkbM family methyltransferase